jgi:hypothetical protein
MNSRALPQNKIGINECKYAIGLEGACVVRRHIMNCEISGSHGGEYEDDCLQEC